MTAPPIDPLDKAAQALPSFDDANTADDIIWNDDPRFYRNGGGHTGFSRLSPSTMMVVLEAKNRHADGKPESSWYNS